MGLEAVLRITGCKQKWLVAPAPVSALQTGHLILPIADSELIIEKAEAELAAIDAVTVVPPSYRSADGEAASQLIA